MWLTKLKKQLALIILLFILTMVCVANYVPNTWLTGWDNLHPEFNFALNARRAFFSVWQEYQGLGLLSGMAHAADLFRVLFLWLMSIFIPNSLSRYFYHFLMLFIGALGAYFFSKNIVQRDLTNHKREIALVVAVFYLLNFGTVQYFFTPFEPFSTFWGFFPWEMYVLFKYLFNPTRRHLLILAVVNLLASAQAYVQPLFLIYGLVIGLVSLGFLKNHKTVKSLKTVIIAGTTVLLVNAFWLLPNTYFVFNKVSVTQNAMNNRMNTERFFQWSRGHGTIKDFVLLRNMPYDESATKDENTDYMKLWRSYFNWPLVEVTSAGFFVLGVLGLLLNKRWQNYFLPSFLLIAIGLLSETPVFDLANQALRQLPLVSQVLRNPFTKLVVPLVFLVSLGIGFSIEKLLIWLKKYTYVHKEIIYLFFGLIIYFSLPVFSGSLFSNKVRQKIPNEYLTMFEYFQKQNPHSRIMNLPQDSYWGWGSYGWGSLGSGFLWYGIKQPIMDRAFDVWSKELEGYYWELIFALRTKNQDLFNQLVDKYDIAYIVYDLAYTPSDQINVLNLRKQQDLLTNDPRYSLVWNQGTVFIYQVNSDSSWIKILPNLPAVNIESFMHFDKAYEEKGNYIASENKKIVYPFNSFFSSRFANEAGFKVEESKQYFVLKSKINQQTFKIKKPPNSLNLVKDKPYQEQSYYLNPNQDNNGEVFQLTTDNLLRTYAKKQSLDAWWSLPNASSSAHLLKIKSRTVEGFPLTLTVSTLKDKHKYLLTLLNQSEKWQTQYWVLPGFEEFDKGIEIRLNNHSFNQTPSVSEIAEISLTPFSLKQLSIKPESRVITESLDKMFFQAENYWLYKFEIKENSRQQTLYLSQAFDPGWRAYLNGRELKDHVLVNNWANGWVVPENACVNGDCQVKIIFWPQYLQFIGFGLLIITIIFTLISSHIGCGRFLYKEN